MIPYSNHPERIMSSEDSFHLWLNELIKTYELILDPDSKFRFGSIHDMPFTPFGHQFIVYEDWWVRKPEIIKSKIKSILGISKKINARQCAILNLSKPLADAFLEENHIYGSTHSKIKFGLFYENELMAVATFASQRQFKTERSGELIRYCPKNGYTVVGGLGKVLNAYINKYHPDSLMTYIDPDWGTGEAFKKLGFETVEVKKPIAFYIDKLNYHRISERNFDDFKNLSNYYKLSNRGTLKMIKKISHQ